ncbi:hypothetical protein D9M68_948610 [compost metagenome]
MVPFQLVLGTKVTVAPLPVAGTLSPRASAAPFSSRVPSAGRDLMTKWPTVPSRSEPLRTTRMPDESSFPEAEAAAVSGASLIGATLPKLSSPVSVRLPSLTV